MALYQEIARHPGRQKIDIIDFVESNIRTYHQKMLGNLLEFKLSNNSKRKKG